MAHLLRGKQSGISNDFSARIGPDSFVLDDINRFGINSQISALAYEPVQSLLAIGTNESKFGAGQIYIFGQKRVSAVFNLERRSSVRSLHFCGDKLICLDVKNHILVYSLEQKKLLSSCLPPGTVFAVCCDTSIDYMFLGMQTGDVLAYDIDRGRMAPFKLPSFWKEHDPRARVTPIQSLSLHPRDIGSLLIGYAEGAVIYSIKQNKPTRFFQYEVPRGAPGGDGDMASSNVVRHPRLTQALWHPTGTFILTGHEDGSLVFWDTKDGRIVMARSITDTNINKPGMMNSTQAPGHTVVKEPLYRIVWCANQDPEDTAILISGGASSSSPAKGLTLLELGRTPIYATSSWQVLSQYLESPKRQRMLPIPPNTEVIDFCLIPKDSPYFDGAHDPIAIIALLGSGELITMSFPSGYPVSPTNQLHISATFVHPFLTSINLSPMERARWLGMKENRNTGPLILKGGAEAIRPSKRHENRNIVQTAHADGTIRLWDAGHGDDIENDSVIQVDVDRAVGRIGGVEITKMSLSGASGEFAVGTKDGELVIFRWGHNRNLGREAPESGPPRPGELIDITNRGDPKLSDGLLPYTMVDMQNGPVTAVKNADVGFVAVGFHGGRIIVIDMRGPAICFNASIPELLQREKRSRHAGPTQGEYVTTLEFSVMSLDGDGYSSILLHVGTSGGSLITMKVLPQNGGKYGVQPVGVAPVDDTVIRIAPLQIDTGIPAYASQQVVANLRSGAKVNGVILVVTSRGIRIFKPPTNKGASKSFDNFICQSATVTHCNEQGYALVTLGDDGYARAFSIPGLRELGAIRITSYLDPRRLSEAIITNSGDILGYTGPAETALLNVWGRGLLLNMNKDLLWNPQLSIPPRPTISNVQWIAGTQYVTPADIDMLIGGPGRGPSRHAVQQGHTNAGQSREVPRAGSSTVAATAAAAGSSQEGYWGYMQRQITERTEKLGTLSDNVDSLQETSQTWANEAGKFVQRQKRNLVLGAVKGKFGV